jgi:transposase
MKKEVKHYSDEFKQSVVKQVLLGCICKEEARRRYGIKGKSAVLNWIRKFDGSQTYQMKNKSKAKLPGATQLEAENKRLRQEIELERLRVLSLNVMIDLAEEQFKIPIRKKSGAKQSKK